jgi:hypothetical protein
MKYYFITYQRAYDDGSGARLSNVTTQLHPLEWIKTFKTIHTNFIFTLVWWTEITKAEYELS